MTKSPRIEALENKALDDLTHILCDMPEQPKNRSVLVGAPEKPYTPKKERQGFLLYYDKLKAIATLDAVDFKTLILSLGDYSQYGVLPETLSPHAEGMFKILKLGIDADAAKYAETCKARSASAKKRHDKPAED